MYLVLALHTEGLPQSGAAYFQFIVLFLPADFRLDKAAQVRTILNPHALGMVYLHGDSVVRTDFHVHEEVVLTLQPFFHGLLNCCFVNHVCLVKSLV